MAVAERAGLRFVCAGKRGGGSCESRLDYAWAAQFMDPRDRGEGVEPKERKEQRAWMRYDWDPTRWAGKSLPADVERLMTHGAEVTMDASIGAFEVKQYPWPSKQSLVEGILEADRSLCVGAMEYVPAEDVATVYEV